MSRTQLLCFAMALLALPSVALADSLSPDTLTRTIGIGESFDIQKTFAVDGRDSNTPLDVLFLFDTTGSFQSRYTLTEWSSTVAPSLISGAQALSNDVRFAVSHYEDYNTSPWGGPSDVFYGSLTGFTSDTTTALGALTTGIAGVTQAATGGDTFESSTEALFLSTQESWRSGAAKIVIWVGDAAGHEPTDTDIIAGAYPGTHSTADVIAEMVSQGIIVEAFNFGALDGRGQATATSDGTGGGLWDASTGTDLQRVQAFLGHYGSALEDAFALYDVGLDLGEVLAGVDVSVLSSPATTSGDRTSGPASYEWTLRFTGVAPGTFAFPIYATIDGVRVVFEDDTITVRRNGTTPPNGEIPEPTTVALLGLGLLGLGVAARRRIKK